MKIYIHHLYKRAIVAFVLFTAISCSKTALNVNNPNQVSEKNFWVNEKDALAGLYGVYDAFQHNQLTGRFYSQFDNLSDNAYTNSGNNWSDIESSNHTPANARIVNFWTQYYTIVNRANLVIDRVGAMPETAISEASRKRIVAEAMFLRAYAYLDLTTLWGNVPFYTRYLAGFDEGAAPANKEVILVEIQDGLKNQVIPHLPVTIGAAEKGRIGKGAAIALLGKYYLFNKDYGNAANTLRELFSAPYNYSLYPDYAKLFTSVGEFSSENLFEINFETGGIDNGESFSIQIDTNLTPTVPRNEWRPTNDLANSFLYIDGLPRANSALYGSRSPLFNSAQPYANRDPRLRANLFTNADVTPGGKKIWAFTNNVLYATKKWFMLTSTQYNGGPQNYYLIRYADVLLMYAEAQNEQAGPDNSVYEAVNKIRRRIGMADYPSGLTQEDMRARIRDERRWEFAFEHQRYFDLLRWRIAHTLIPPSHSKKVFTNPRDYLWPYPQDEMDNSPALQAYGQNEGWK
jgi:hypothetical protein